MDKNQTIFGIRAIIEAIDAGKEIEKVYLQKELKNALINELTHLVKKNKISSSYVPIEKLNKLAKYQNHQGAVAKISQVEFADLETIITTVLTQNKAANFLLLDQVSDVRNFGAILRTAECAGVDAVIIPNHGNAPLNADAIKTSAGAAFKIPICKVEHAKDAVFLLQAHNIKIVSVTEKTNDILFDVDLKQSIALVLGSEHKGISPSILKISDYKAKLPLLGTIESLNVSVAGGIAMYEVVRQRLKK
ncbi:MAG TPA: 23S rRNA (guanosine(2251)-2'-O)-methyltransferase RlmB [Flavobacteriia bacterium]|nr:23S rRNA (guanosine(2251)-2'-O)-methyltransferase RlmB [Flavobacteriia bacterium]